jgi:hypothetical protein
MYNYISSKLDYIKDILKLDLNEDIKNVIDLEDQSENEIQSELESYIITDGLGNIFLLYKNNTRVILKKLVFAWFYGSKILFCKTHTLLLIQI